MRPQTYRALSPAMLPFPSTLTTPGYSQQRSQTHQAPIPVYTDPCPCVFGDHTLYDLLPAHEPSRPLLTPTFAYCYFLEAYGAYSLTTAFHPVLQPMMSFRDHGPDLAPRSRVYMSQSGCHGISDSLRTQGSSRENSETLQLK